MRINTIFYTATPSVKSALDGHIHANKAQISHRCIKHKQKCKSHNEREKKAARTRIFVRKWMYVKVFCVLEDNMQK